ncbi:efflux RND transporter periplasmic adaptor subunit [Acidithiobacillus sp.]|uniref:efflux RND transporter periplasmic adaptor subunit n=1 Tax=Acidithiobacillus sp. TaxID=1872118 RepID=UPI003CFC549E
MKKAFVAMLIIVALLFGGIFAWYGMRQRALHSALAAHAHPPVTVSAAKVRKASWTPRMTAVGEIVADQGAALSPQTAGVVQSVFFRSGQSVSKGTLLLQINPGPLPGEIRAARAQAELAAVDYRRAQKLYAIHGISTAALDRARYTSQAAQAKVAALQESLADTQIRAPFSGVLGLRTVNPGQYLRTDQAVIHIENLNHLYADFTIPQRDLAAISVGAPITLSIHAGDALHHYAATVRAIDSHVDRRNRAVAVRAQVRQPQGLRPGMFVKAELKTAAAQAVLAIPMTAVSFNTYGDFVFVLRPQGSQGALVAEEEPVTLGTQQDGEVAVRSGVQAGDLVVTAGQVKLHSGDIVHLNNAVQL